MNLTSPLPIADDSPPTGFGVARWQQEVWYRLVRAARGESPCGATLGSYPWELPRPARGVTYQCVASGLDPHHPAAGACILLLHEWCCLVAGDGAKGTTPVRLSFPLPRPVPFGSRKEAAPWAAMKLLAQQHPLPHTHQIAHEGAVRRR